jgi:hypothetical protein
MALGEPTLTLLPYGKNSQNPFKLFLNITTYIPYIELE